MKLQLPLLTDQNYSTAKRSALESSKHSIEHTTQCNHSHDGHSHDDTLSYLSLCLRCIRLPVTDCIYLSSLCLSSPLSLSLSPSLYQYLLLFMPVSLSVCLSAPVCLPLFFLFLCSRSSPCSVLLSLGTPISVSESVFVDDHYLIIYYLYVSASLSVLPLPSVCLFLCL